MLGIGDIHIFVTDVDVALRFWGEGAGLEVVEREVTANSAFGRLESPDGGSGITLIGPVDPWQEGERPPLGARPMIRFDLLTTDFEATLARLLECGGTQDGPVEAYDDLRVVAICDPDGNTFELLEVREEDVVSE